MTGIINRTLTRQYETTGVKGRNAGFSLNNYDISYGYDSSGRMDEASWNVNSRTGTAAYGYVQNSDLLASLSVNNSFSTSYSYEPHRNVKTSVQNAYGVQVISNYAYRYDALGRRTSVVNTGAAFTAEAHNAYGYNDRNELTESSRYMGTDPDNITQPVEPEYRAYRYDPIGNRAQITEAANTGTFTANNLNQYTGQAVPGDGTRSFDYDADGNLISLIENGSEKVYTWNAENRLTSVAPRTPAAGDKKVEFIYDYMGRRVKKSVYAYTSDSWLLTSEFFFVYDGWNLVEEISEAGAAQTSRYFVWGQDLSQSLQGAGGIGGLIATVDGAAGYLYCFDANGNVGQVVNAADGAIAAKYEYDPYGKPIKAVGAYAVGNPFRFSTKYHDDETGLVYYGYRYYSAELGRWLSRDPMGEEGGKNLYIFIGNEGVSRIDAYGLFEWESLINSSLSKSIRLPWAGWEFTATLQGSSIDSKKCCFDVMFSGAVSRGVDLKRYLTFVNFPLLIEAGLELGGKTTVCKVNTKWVPNNPIGLITLFGQASFGSGESRTHGRDEYSGFEPNPDYPWFEVPIKPNKKFLYGTSVLKGTFAWNFDKGEIDLAQTGVFATLQGGASLGWVKWSYDIIDWKVYP